MAGIHEMRNFGLQIQRLLADISSADLPSFGDWLCVEAISLLSPLCAKSRFTAHVQRNSRSAPLKSVAKQTIFVCGSTLTVLIEFCPV